MAITYSLACPVIPDYTDCPIHHYRMADIGSAPNLEGTVAKLAGCFGDLLGKEDDRAGGTPGAVEVVVRPFQIPDHQEEVAPSPAAARHHAVGNGSLVVHNLLYSLCPEEDLACHSFRNVSALDARCCNRNALAVLLHNCGQSALCGLVSLQSRFGSTQALAS
jgi:hypothetical protein